MSWDNPQDESKDCPLCNGSMELIKNGYGSFIWVCEDQFCEFSDAAKVEEYDNQEPDYDKENDEREEETYGK